MNRRGFLAGILAAGAAPAIVRAGVLMPMRSTIITPPPLFNGGLGLFDSIELSGRAGQVLVFRADKLVWADPAGERLRIEPAGIFMPQSMVPL